MKKKERIDFFFLRKGDRGNEGRMEKEKCHRKNTSEDPSSLKKMKGR